MRVMNLLIASVRYCKMDDLIRLTDVAEMFKTDYNIVKSWATRGYIQSEVIDRKGKRFYSRRKLEPLAEKYLSEKGTYVSQQELRKRTKFPDSKIARLIHDGEIHPVGETLFGTRLFRSEDVDRLIEEDTITLRTASRLLNVQPKLLKEALDGLEIKSIGLNGQNQKIYRKRDIFSLKGSEDG